MSLPYSRWLFALIYVIPLVTFIASGVFGLSTPILQARDVLAGHAKTWNLASGKYVRMHIEDSMHYQVNSHENDGEYAQLWPAHGHLVGVPNDPQAYTVGMFHQLRCLDVIHTSYLQRNTSTPSKLVEHCLNYLRQCILCESSTRLESVHKHIPPKVVVLTGEYRCRDWTSLYSASATM